MPLVFCHFKLIILSATCLQWSMSPATPIVIEITQSLNLFRILEVNDGSIWFGAFDGVYRYDGNTITDFKERREIIRQ